MPLPSAVLARQAAELEAARLRLLAVTPAALLPTVVGELERREQLFRDSARRSPVGGQPPAVAALESVYLDVAYGRLR